MSGSGSPLRLIDNYVREAERTDRKLPAWIPFLPLITIIAIYIALMIAIVLGSEALAITLAYVAALAFTIIAVLVIYTFYKLIVRRNEHFRRSHMLWSGVVDYLESRGVGGSRVEAVRRLLEEARWKEGEKSAALWTVASLFIPLAAYYVFHFLNKDFVGHERREIAMLRELQAALKEHNVSLSIPEPAVRDRNTILYLIASILIPFVGLYWFYATIKDGNAHFDWHSRVDREILNALSRLA